MVRIWMNHWFSTAYNIVNLIKQDDPEFFVIGSNENVGSPIRTVCDEWYHEPTLKDDTYVDYCVEFCREHYVDVFLPRRGMLDISKHIQRFASIGTKVMVDDYSLISVLNHKNEAYELFKKEGIGIVPEYRMVTTTEQFCRGYSELKEVVANWILKQNGITNVRIEHIPGSLTDHYDPTQKVLRLSDSVYGSVSMAAIGVAAHECGHAIQDGRSWLIQSTTVQMSCNT